MGVFQTWRDPSGAHVIFVGKAGEDVMRSAFVRERVVRSYSVRLCDDPAATVLEMQSVLKHSNRLVDVTFVATHQGGTAYTLGYARPDGVPAIPGAESSLFACAKR